MNADIVKIRDKEFSLFIAEDRIQAEVERVAACIDKNFEGSGSAPIFIVVTNGAMMFASDIIRNVTIPCEVRCIRLSSYHGGTESTGVVQEVMGLGIGLAGKDVIIVEDIIDTGNTIHELKQKLEKEGVKSITTCTCLFKPDACQHDDAYPDLWGFVIDNLFVVGYGMDYKEQGRNLKHVYILKQ